MNQIARVAFALGLRRHCSVLGAVVGNLALCFLLELAHLRLRQHPALCLKDLWQEILRLVLGSVRALF